MKRHAITIEDLWALPRVGAPAASPQGDRILVPVTSWSMETNESTTRLWLVDARPGGKGETRPLTAPEDAVSGGRWDPEGRRVAYAKRTPEEDHAQLYLLDLSGGEPRKLTDFPLGVLDPRWFPDGRRIAFLAPVLEEAPTPEGTSRLLERREKEPLKVEVTEDRVYRYWDHWLTRGKYHHIFILDTQTGEYMDLLPGSRRWFHQMDPAGQYRISPDGAEICFSACRTDPPHDPVLWGTFTVKVPARVREGAKVPRPRCLLPRHPAGTTHGVYSPDGRWLVYGFQRERDFYADRVRLAAVDRRTGKTTVLTEDWDRSAAAWDFTPDSRRLVVQAEDNARVSLFSLDLRAALRDPGGHPPTLLVKGGHWGAPVLSGGHIFATLDSLRQPAEVYRLDLDGKNRRRLTSFTRETMRELDLGAVQSRWFRGANGERVQMYLIWPPGVKPPAKGRRPRRSLSLMHVIHGGPHGISGDTWHWRWNPQVFSAVGHLVAMVNFHGSTSWGQEFAQCIQGEWGEKPCADILAATDDLVEAGYVDANRMAATGGSYGGYLTSWIASQTDRFACVVNHAGVCDFQMQLSSDVTQGWHRAMGGTLWDGIDRVDAWNPIRHAGGFSSPMLILHGELDYRVPYYQGLQIYNVYRMRGLPARLAVYPDENHWILTPRASRHWYGEVLGWLERWLES